jgi:hypothetical protein
LLSAGALPPASAAPLPLSVTAEFVPVETPPPPVTYSVQMRIEQRVIIRVPRHNSAQRKALFDQQRPAEREYEEKKFGKCLAMGSIRSVRIEGGRNLQLLLADQRLVRAKLEKSCEARSFYSGFYMEKSDDGRICTERDTLLSRSGAKCTVDEFRLLVED